MTHRLAVYGTLAPGRANAYVLDGIDGTWTPGVVRGTRHDVGWGAARGYPGIVLDDAADVECMVLTSAELPAHWARLDDFEGPGYRRVVVPVRTADGMVDAHIYALAREYEALTGTAHD